MLTVSSLYIYPIKSLGGIAIDSATVTDRGFEHDRRWMLVDENNAFLTQREHSQMALLQPGIEPDGLRVTHKGDHDTILIPFTPQNTETVEVTVWNDTCTAVLVSHEADAWFSAKLNLNCRLVYMPDDSHRKADEKYAHHGELTSFSDAYPFLIIGQASLDDLNSRIVDPLPMNRFRPNIVFAGAEPFTEDVLKKFSINGIKFNGVKLCVRCVLTTIDQETAIKHKEPLKTLATYRRKGNKIFFGQNLVHTGMGTISVGDELNGVRLHENDERFMV